MKITQNKQTKKKGITLKEEWKATIIVCGTLPTPDRHSYIIINKRLMSYGVCNIFF